ncbi:MAG: hypothetical protein ACRDVE_12335 [Actinocrinis sp.]
MSATFGREMAKIHFEQLFEEARHDRLVGSLKRERRSRKHAQASAPAAVIRRRHGEPCAQDLG